MPLLKTPSRDYEGRAGLVSQPVRIRKRHLFFTQPSTGLPSQVARIFRYAERLTEAGINPSVGSVGDSYDNALAETVIGLYKAEVIHQRSPWRNLDEVEYATLEWVDWFNNRRLLEPIGDVPPAEFEKAYYEQREGQAKAA